MAKILAFCPLYYGRPYIHAAVQSVYDQVDKIVILYTDTPSQGHATHLPCPDTEEELQNEVSEFSDKIKWVKGDWKMEGEHVGAIIQHVEDYEWLWRFDSDEITPHGMIDKMIEQASLLPSARFQVHFQHFWKCFDKVNIDGQTPVRLFRPGGENAETILDSDDGKWRMHHMGYAMPDEYMRFKWTCQAHKPELRPEWYEEVWLKNGQNDVHPVAFGLWPKPEDYDKTKLPEVLKQHEFYNMEIIK